MPSVSCSAAPAAVVVGARSARLRVRAARQCVTAALDKGPRPRGAAAAERALLVQRAVDARRVDARPDQRAGGVEASTRRVLAWRKWPVSNEMPAYRASAARGLGVSPSSAAIATDDSAVLLAARAPGRGRRSACCRGGGRCSRWCGPPSRSSGDTRSDAAVDGVQRHARRAADRATTQVGASRNASASGAVRRRADVDASPPTPELAEQVEHAGGRARAASPSGFSWIARATRRSPRMARQTAARSAARASRRVLAPRPRGRRRRRRRRSARRRPRRAPRLAPQQLSRCACAAVGRLVVDERELRGALEAQLGGDPRLQEAVRRSSAVHASLRARAPRRGRSRRPSRGAGPARLDAVTVTKPTRGSLRSLGDGRGQGLAGALSFTLRQSASHRASDRVGAS